jgi:hypothetical protein
MGHIIIQGVQKKLPRYINIKKWVIILASHYRSALNINNGINNGIKYQTNLVSKV